MYVGLHVRGALFLSDFNEILIFLSDFRKKCQISKFIKIRPEGGESMRTGGQTDRQTWRR